MRFFNGTRRKKKRKPMAVDLPIKVGCPLVDGKVKPPTIDENTMPDCTCMVLYCDPDARDGVVAIHLRCIICVEKEKQEVGERDRG